MSRQKQMEVGADAVADAEMTGASRAQPLLRLAEEMLRRQLALPLAPALYLVATPIGNLADMSLRALAVLARADVVYCEDTRHSLKLLNHYGIAAPLRSYHEHNAERERGPLLAQIEAGRSVALISDAGTPLVSDPGYKLVREAHARGLSVIAIPGASAVLAALASAGLPSDEFHFAGFLPQKSAARRRRLVDLAGIEATLIFFESPKRLVASLADMHASLGDRPAVIARELTKLHETLVQGGLGELAARIAAGGDVKGEIVVLVAPGAPAAQGIGDDELRQMLARELETASLRDAVRSVSERSRIARSRVYDLAVAMRDEDAPA